MNLRIMKIERNSFLIQDIQIMQLLIQKISLGWEKEGELRCQFKKFAQF